MLREHRRQALGRGATAPPGSSSMRGLPLASGGASCLLSVGDSGGPRRQIARPCAERKEHPDNDERSKVQCGSVDRRLILYPYADVGERESEKKENEAGGDHRRVRRHLAR